MIAVKANDKCFSTALDGRNPFNTDGIRRTELSIDEARSALDFNIIKKQSYDREGRAIPDNYHLVRDDDNAFIPAYSVGSRFTPVQHIDVFEYITTKIMPQVPDMKLELCGTIHGGGVGIVAAKLGDTFAMPGDDSPSHLRLMFANPSNGRGCLTLGFTTVRVVCQNTLLAATNEAKADGWTVRHTKSAPDMTVKAIESIRAQAVAALEIKRRCERLARIGVDRATVERCLEAVYPINNLPEGHARTRLLNIRASVLEQFESGDTAQTMKQDTAWKLFNSFTFPIFHPDKISKRVDSAQIQYSGMTGSVAQKVRGIFNTVETVAA